MKTFAGSRVAVTGGGGFIGSHLVHHLLKGGVEEVLVIDNFSYGRRDNLRLAEGKVTISEISLGISDASELDRVLDGVDFVFHLAAEKHNQSKNTPYECFRSNINGTFSLLESCVRSQVKKVVYASSLYAYGRMEKPTFVETEVPHPNTVYGISKLAGEHMLEYFAKYHKLDYGCVRYLFVYGPLQFAGMGYESVIVKNFRRMLRGEPAIVFGDGNQEMDYIFVDDAVEATVEVLLANGTPDVFNIGSGVGISINQLTDVMIDVAGSSVGKVFEAPDWTANSSRVANIEKISTTLNWRPKTHLRDGLQKTFNWIKESGQ